MIRRCLLILVAAIAAGAVFTAPAAPQSGSVSAARAEEQQLGAAIVAQSEQIDIVQARAAAAARQLERSLALLASTRARLSELDATLRRQRAEITRLRGQLRIAEARLGERLVEIYQSDMPGMVEIVLGARNLDELLEQVDAASRTARQDEQIAGQISGARTSLELALRRTRALRREQAERVAQAAALTARQERTLAGLRAEAARIAALQAQRRRALEGLRVTRQRWESEAAAAAAAAASVRQAASVDSSGFVRGSGGGFIWPVHGALVSPFGMRWGRLHAGLDIAAGTGTPIVASAGGQVTYAGEMSGYGLVVVIDHGNGISTAYAHDSSISVSAGQTVGQGQMIAAVGCTGHCFGSHVHFEVRVGGSPVDPLRYL